MRWMKWISIIAALTVIVCCFYPWMVVESRNIVVSGVSAEGTRFGKPGYLHLLLSGLYLFFAFIPKLWAKRINLFLATLNVAWALRNFILMSRCEGGECPVRKIALPLLFLASILMLLSTALSQLAPKNKVKNI